MKEEEEEEEEEKEEECLFFDCVVPLTTIYISEIKFSFFLFFFSLFLFSRCFHSMFLLLCSAPGAELQELQSGEIVFQSGALVVMFDQTLRTQRFFQGHDEAITAMAVHPDKVVVATSQGGKKNGTVCIWNSGARPAEWSPTERTEEEEHQDGAVMDVRKRVEEMKRILIPKNVAGMGSMDFNQKGELLAMVTSVGDGEFFFSQNDCC